jgi:hypothetical protein
LKYCEFRLFPIGFQSWAIRVSISENLSLHSTGLTDAEVVSLPEVTCAERLCPHKSRRIVSSSQGCDRNLSHSGITRTPKIWGGSKHYFVTVPHCRTDLVTFHRRIRASHTIETILKKSKLYHSFLVFVSLFRSSFSTFGWFESSGR